MQNNHLRLTEGNKWLKKDKMASEALDFLPWLISGSGSGSTLSLFLIARLLLQHHCPPSLLGCLCLLYALNHPILFLLPNFPLSLEVSPHSSLLNLPEPISLQVSPLTMQRLNL